MVNLVIVSHSHQVAEGVKTLADQMANHTVKIVAVGGIQDHAGEWLLGTDAVRVAAAIEHCWTLDGVLILADLGSAVLSAECAVELLPDEMQPSCLISGAPLVEGAVVAAVEAGFGHVLAVVNQAAEAANIQSKITPKL